MSECFGIAAKHNVDVIQLAVDPDRFRSNHKIVVRRRAFLFRSVFRIRIDVKDLLEIPLRVVLASPEKRGSEDEEFELLFMRFRENEERENLGPFERLLSIGEMFENLKANSLSSNVTAVSFAKRIGVHESIVSRGRAVFRDRKQILNKFKNAHDLSFPDLQRAVSSLADTKETTAKASQKQKKIVVTRSV